MTSHANKINESTVKPEGKSGASTQQVKKPADSNLSKGKIKPGLIACIIITLFFALAMFIRVYFPFNQVFTNVGIKFTSNDTYFFMRLVDNLVHNFPHHTQIDPYLQYPGVPGAVSINFFVWLLAVPAWLFGGANNQHTIDVVDAYLPAIMGALTVIPVYFIGKTLFNRWAGVLAAGLIAILPGEFMGRSILGFTDNHVAETLFTAITIMFLVLALKTARQNELTFAHLKNRDWPVIKNPIIYSLLAAFFLGIYIFTWLGALLFVFITFLFFVLQFIIDHLKRKSTDYLSIVGVIFFLIALLMAMSISSNLLYTASLFIAVLAMPALRWLSGWMSGKKLTAVLYPLALIALAGIGIGLIFVADRSLFNAMLNAFSLFKPAGAQLTTIEMQPLISPIYGNPFTIAWGNFNISFFLSCIALLVLLYMIIRQGSAEKTLLVVWSLVILLATLGQRRFGYYLSVNFALLTGYLSWQVLELVNNNWLNAENAGPARRAAVRRAQQKAAGFSLTVNHFVMIVVVIIIFSVVYAPNILYPSFKESPAITVASSAPYAPNDGWVTSMEWLKNNSPEPFGTADAYYQIQPALKSGETYQYPASAYGVLAWWDYGYWITRIAHRIPNANPSQDPKAILNVANFFTSQNETSAAEIRQTLGTAYVVIDYETTLSKFWAIVTWANKAPFFDSYVVQQQDKSFRQVILYYPEYYRSMAVRMFNFEGQAVTPDTTFVIASQQQKDKSGNIFKVVTDVKQYPTYQEAENFLASGNLTGNYRIVGIDPMKSPVPLDALQHYSLVNSSNSTIGLQNGTSIPVVKIFEYVK